jgi:tripartite-type tricarboxylate transporter receptor subunit TctC
VLNDPTVRARIEEQGGIPDPGSPEQYAALSRAESAKWKRVADAAGCGWSRLAGALGRIGSARHP